MMLEEKLYMIADTNFFNEEELTCEGMNEFFKTKLRYYDLREVQQVYKAIP